MNNRRNFLGGLALLPFIPNVSLGKEDGLKEKIISEIYQGIDLKKINHISYTLKNDEKVFDITVKSLVLSFYYIDEGSIAYELSQYEGYNHIHLFSIESTNKVFTENSIYYENILSVQELLEIGEYFRNLNYER